MRKTVLLLSIIMLTQTIYAQDIQVYHGRKKETTVYNSKGESVTNYRLYKKQKDAVSIRILNPNPIFYKYELKYQESEIEAESKEITDLLVQISVALVARTTPPVAGAAPGVEPTYKIYQDALNKLLDEINTAKKYVAGSDNPELPKEAREFRRTGGLRKAIDQIDALPATANHFNDPKLLDNLNTLCNQIVNIDDYIKKGLLLLNTSIVQNVNNIKKSATDQAVATVITADFNVTEKKGEIYLVISKADPNATVKRDFHSGTEQIKLATVIPYYERAVLEIVPVGNFLFAGQEKEFFIENNIVGSREVKKTRFMPGVVLNVNAFRFGETREMSLGFGPGYNFTSANNAFNNFYLSTLFSYKNIIRVGAGFGFAQYADGLKDGATVDNPLPAKIENLDKVIVYKEKPTFFLTIAIAGLNLTKKN
ncbi:hypothetical protein AAHN97_11665 [Chitinophaga niabensis]|uniref:hypothetical protein n=1 Tax=Chitinophaga niabensis TaxID=536979 RepID=UPI0031BAE03F